MKRYLQPLAGAILLVVILASYVTLKVAGDLKAVRSILAGDVSNIEAADVKEAEARLESAQRTLRSVPARMLRVIPILGQNLGAISSIVDSSIPVLDAGSDLTEALAPLRDGALIEDKRIDASRIADLESSASRQEAALQSLAATSLDVRSGWLVPPVWDAVDELAARSGALLQGASNLTRFVSLSDDMLGVGAPRTYLVLLLNNAELRGAGGILAGVGTIRFDDGAIRIGKFRSVHALQSKPYESVPAPADYERRYAGYKANTTLWLNASFSPDVPDVGLVASRLYEKTTGTKTDGALVLDPRGIEALLPKDAEVEVPGGDRIPADEVARFIYSDAYALYENQVARRNAILALGESAFDTALGADFGGTDGLSRIGGALAGGHIRFTSFQAEEQEVLVDADVAGELDAKVASFPLQVVAQNFGSDNGQGTKLDFWADRTIEVDCALEVEDDSRMECRVETTVANTVPSGLGEYVGGKPYGILTTLVETYLPEGGEVTSSSLDGDSAETFIEDEGTSTSVGMFAEIAPGEQRTVSVSFTWEAPDDGFTFSFTPQPLAKDARLAIQIALPPDWRSVSPQGEPGVASEVTLNHEVKIQIEPDPHAGFGAVWQSLGRFWREPPF